jgi:PAS domain S-box-containing protein
VRYLTENKQAEERLRSVVNHVIDGIITIDEYGKVESFNPAAEKIFGYSAAEVVGRNINMLMPAPYHDEHNGYLENYRRTGIPKIIGIGREVSGRRSDGIVFPMELAVSEFRVEGRRYFTGIVRDITERKRLEQELHQRIEQLAEADRRKDEFLAMLAHELRNPLAAIHSAVQLSALSGLEEHINWSMDVINRQIKHLTRLIDDLLDVSRITRGKIDLRKETVDVATIVNRAVESVRLLIDQRQHQLAVSCSPGTMWLEADPTRLEQILVNLLSNAAKYTDDGGRIWLSAGRDGDEIVIRVRDSGVGIPSAVLPRMFDLFAQGDRSLARSEGGLGIGLTLVRSLTELHGGRVEAASEGLGKGSEFVVRLPAARFPRPGTERPGEAPAPIQPKRSRRILIVDDNVDTARGLARLLMLLGHETQVAYDGPSAPAAVEEFQPDTVLLDIGLPGMDGYEVARKLRALPRGQNLLLVAVTGYGQETDRRRARETGFDHHLTKPIDFKTVVSLIGEAAC